MGYVKKRIHGRFSKLCLQLKEMASGANVRGQKVKSKVRLHYSAL